MSYRLNIARRFIMVEGIPIDLDKTMTYIRMKCDDDGVPQWVCEAMLSVVNELVIGAVLDEEEMIPLWNEDDMATLGWFLRIHGQTSGNSMFEPIDIDDDETIQSGFDSPTGVDEIWPTDESTDGSVGLNTLDGGITDEDMECAFMVLELLNAPIGSWDTEDNEI